MRVKRGIARHRRHKKIRGMAKGYRGMRKSTFKKANEAVMKAGQHAYKDRRRKKRTFRSLWIIRMSAALREQGVSYSHFIKVLKDNKIELDRKVLSEIALQEPKVFFAIMQNVNLGKKEDK